MAIVTHDERTQPVVPVSAAEERAFRQDGFLLLRRVLTPAKVKALLEEVERLVGEASASGGVLREPYYHENSYKLVRILRFSDAFDALIDHPGYFGKLVSLIGSHIQLMGSEIFVRGVSDTDITGFHTDCGPGLQGVLPDEDNAFLQIKAQIFLTDLSSPDAGNFALIPGSHRVPPPDRNPLCMVESLNRRIGLTGELPSDAVQILANPGDVLLFPHSLWHAVARNHSGRTRYSIALRYGLTALRPMERFDPVLNDPTRRLSPRQRRLLSDYGRDGASPYRPPEQEAIILGSRREVDSAGVASGPPAVEAWSVTTRARKAASGDAVLSVATVALAANDSGCSGYLSALRDAIQEEPMPCGTRPYAEMYETAAESGQWLVISLLKRASGEAGAARRLWHTASRCADQTMRDHLRKATIRRSDHVCRYIELIDLAFPEAISTPLREDFNALKPEWSGNEPLDGLSEGEISAEDVVELNLEAIRYTVLADLEARAIGLWCAPEDEARAAEAVKAIRIDHLDQVDWTAQWLEAAAGLHAGSDLRELLLRGLKAFNRETAEEPLDLSYHQRFGSHP